MLILTAALVMSVLGLIFGALLGVTGRVFKVPANEKAEALRECGVRCGLGQHTFLCGEWAGESFGAFPAHRW